MTLNDKNYVCVQNSHERELHRAGFIIVDSSTIIENGFLEIENGVITGVHKGSPKEKSIDHGPGVLMPPLVNTHLHLELSALKNKVSFDEGFKFWVNTLLKKRNTLGKETLIASAQKAAGDLAMSGNLYIGDVSTLGITRPIIENSGLNGACFHEYLGAVVPSFFPEKNGPVSSCVAGHAPHTTSPELLKALKKYSTAQGLAFSIHVAESDEETAFLFCQKGAWADFLTSRGIDWSSWNIGSKTPVRYINDIGLLDPLTIAVHVLNVLDKDIKLLARSNTKVCLCPRSNWNLHKKLPDIEKLIQNGIQPALGTDSLASCDSLNIFDEMAFVRKKYPGLDPETIFSMGTINGARALGIERLTGTLSKGKKAQFLYRSIQTKNKKDIFSGIISNE